MYSGRCGGGRMSRDEEEEVMAVVLTTCLNLNSLLVKRQIDNSSPGAVTGGN